MANSAPIIVIKRKGGHGGHHGGAWKVAYADFVTAMMALFIVLWLLNTSKQIQKAVGGYFKDPTGTSKMVGNGQNGSGEFFSVSKDNLDQLKDELQNSIKKMADFEKLKDHIEMTVTSEGLRVELTESDMGTFFNTGNSQPSESGKQMLKLLAEELGKLPNKLSIEGHTDSRPFLDGKNYGNWELSTERANASRRLMQESGVRADQVTEVRGYADQRLRKPDHPEDPGNRRVSLIVQHLIVPPSDDDDEPDEPAEKAKSPEEKGKAPEAKSSPAEAKPAEAKAHH